MHTVGLAETHTQTKRMTSCMRVGRQTSMSHPCKGSTVQWLTCTMGLNMLFALLGFCSVFSSFASEIDTAFEVAAALVVATALRLASFRSLRAFFFAAFGSLASLRFKEALPPCQ